MIKLLIFSVLGLAIGGGLGFGGGIMLFPKEETADAEPTAESEELEEVEEVAYADFSEQFIVPIMRENEVEALMVLSIAIEVDAEALQSVYEKEPKLRAEFLQSLFNHANNGGFSGNYTQFSPMASLKRELRHIAQGTAGPAVRDVLILDAIRQE